MNDDKTYWVQIRLDDRAYEKAKALADLLYTLNGFSGISNEKIANALEATCEYSVWCEE